MNQKTIFCVLVAGVSPGLHKFDTERTRLEWLAEQADPTQVLYSFEAQDPVNDLTIADVGVSARAKLQLLEDKDPPEVVYHWADRRYGGSEASSKPYVLEINDSRVRAGQVQIIFSNGLSRSDKKYLSAQCEVNRLDWSGNDAPCIHLSFPSGELALSLFQDGDDLVIRPESLVQIQNEMIDGTSVMRLREQEA